MSDIDKIVITKVSPFSGYPGEFILMIDGSLWFHPYGGKSKPSEQRASLTRNALDQLACEVLDKEELGVYSKYSDSCLGDCREYNRKRIEILQSFNADFRYMSYAVKQSHGEIVA